MKHSHFLIWMAVGVLLNFALAAEQPAQKANFAKRHPRRAQVNKREHRQDKRIKNGLKDGQLTQAQANDLRSNEKAMKTQEKADVKANGGYLKKSQQKQLNQELNAEDQKVFETKHAGVTQ